MAETIVNLVIQQLNADARAAEEELQGNSNESVQIWVEEVKEEAYRLEDVIDEFTFTRATLPRGGVLQQIYRSIKKLKLHHQIVTDIQDIKSSLVEIDERRKRHGLMMMSIEQGSSSTRGKNVTRHVSFGVGSYYLEPDQIIGRDSTRKQLNDWLVNRRILQQRVIALVGTGGLGKTTPAANVYKNKDVRSHFNCHAWIHVGKPPYIKEDLLRRIIQKVYSSEENSTPRNLETIMDVMELIDMLRKYLENKSYMFLVR
ncbi:hypothetical protein ACOSQ4_013498 [Xanthoceras sorbifolium]